MSEIIRLQDEIRRLNAEIKDLATSNLEAQHRAALEGDRLRALNAEMLDALKRVHAMGVAHILDWKAYHDSVEAVIHKAEGKSTKIDSVTQGNK